MRLLYVSDVFFPRVNGVSTSIGAFAGELRRRGHEVQLLAPRYGDEAPSDWVFRFPGRRVPFDPEDRLMGTGPIPALLPWIRSWGFDLVHVQTPFVAHRLGRRLARTLDLPLVASYHTFFEEYLQHYLPFLPPALLRWAARRFSLHQCGDADRVIVPSRAFREILDGYGVTTPLTVLPTGLDLEELSGGDGRRFRARLGVSAERPLLVHVGRMAHEKNVDFLLHVVGRVRESVPDVLLVLAGEGPAKAHLEELAGELGLGGHVRFVGYLSRDGALQDCFAAGDLFLFASRTETQGLVLLESMALGTPVVSTAVLGTRDVLAAGRGCRVVPEDEEAFAREIARLLGNRAEIAALGREGRREVEERWTIEAATDRLLEKVYGELAGSPGGRPSVGQAPVGSERGPSRPRRQ